MDIKGSQAVILPEGAFVIGTYDAEGKPDAMIAAWGAQSDYGEITFFLAKHKTTENIKVTKAFTVAFATEIILASFPETRTIKFLSPAYMFTRRRMSTHR